MDCLVRVSRRNGQMLTGPLNCELGLWWGLGSGGRQVSACWSGSVGAIQYTSAWWKRRMFFCIIFFDHAYILHSILINLRATY